MKIAFNLTKAAALFILAVLVQSFTAPSGGDHFKITVNDKMLLEHYVNTGQKIQDVSFAAYKASDVLAVQYSHCGQVGQVRSLKIKDAAGKLLKEWKFDGTEEAVMRIPMKEFTASLPKAGGAAVYYASKELPGGTLLCRVLPLHSNRVVTAK